MAQNGRIHRAMVQVAMPRHEPLDGALFLSSRCPDRERSETLYELLNSRDRMIPFERSADGLTMLLSRREIGWVSLNPELSPLEIFLPPELTIVREELVQVHFLDGSEASGLLQMDLPHQRCRASDYMNNRNDFFPLSTPGRILLVNKRAVRDMIVFETSPVPNPSPNGSRVA